MKYTGLSVLALLLSPLVVLAAQEHHVEVHDDFFDPEDITIQAGDTVTWTNMGNMPHNVRADDDSFRCAVGCNGAGDPSVSNWSVSLTFDEPGHIPYFCEAHGAPGIGMTGSVTVEPADEPPGFAINFGLTGTWFNPETSGQGVILDVIPDRDPPQVSAYWFTYALEPGGPQAQRWYYNEGHFEEGSDSVELTVYEAIGGAFDDPAPVELESIGVMHMEFEDCRHALLTYSLDFGDEQGGSVSGEIPIRRLSPDVMCEILAEED